MKKLMFSLMLASMTLSSYGQECHSTGYNPDADESGHINITDLLELLLVFGNDIEPDTLCVDTNWVNCTNPFSGEWWYIGFEGGSFEQWYYITGTGLVPEPNLEDNYAGGNAMFNGYATGSVITSHIQASDGWESFHLPKWYVYDCEADELATANHSSSSDDGERWEYLNQTEYIIEYADQGMYVSMQFQFGDGGTNSDWHIFYRPD
jgi:hypothetical protein